MYYPNRKLVKRVEDWNRDRDNLRLDISLEESMMDEEFKEFKEALEKRELGSIVDAYCDMLFVYYGSVFKARYNRMLLNNFKIKWLMKLKQAYDLIKAYLEFSENKEQDLDELNINLEKSFELVCDYNDEKSNKKDLNGKVIKPNNFIGPESEIYKIFLSSN